jgi:hypothetical protein
MASNNSKLLSGRVQVTPYSNLTSDRYQFLGLNQAEPSLGNGTNNSVLTISTSNTRAWSNSLSLSSLTVTGTTTSGNFATAGNITASFLVSNVATGTAPFTVTSTTQVANLSVATAGSATTAGTVTTNAQPNITSVGTLTSLAVTGTTTSGNFATAGNITASFLVSNVATGTAPFTVTSTTRVANLNVNYANVSDFISVAAGTGNNFLIFANAATGNVTELTSTGLVANLSNNSITATTFVGALSGAATSATTAGTVTTNAQPNITSVGTLSSLTATGNVTGGNLTTGGSLLVTGVSNLGAVGNVIITGGSSGQYLQTNGSGNLTWAAVSSASISNGNSNVNIPAANGNIQVSVAGVANVITFASNNAYRGSYGITGAQFVANTAPASPQPGDQWYNTFNGILFEYLNDGTTSQWVDIGSIPLPNLSSVTTTILTTGANTTAGTITGNWSLSAGSRLTATYADIAEKYVADATYIPGTVLIFGGEQEVTLSNAFDSTKVAGVVSTNPAYSMNSALEAEYVAEIALQGRVPCKVIGPIEKGDLMVSASNGHATSNNDARAGTIIGKALENFNGDFGIIEVAVGRF